MAIHTTIYFVRHAESPYIEGEERTRGLSEKGLRDAMTVKELMFNERIDIFISSPYERAIRTIKNLAHEVSEEIGVEEDLKERIIGEFGNLDFKEAKRKLYNDFDFMYPNGESSHEAQDRALAIVDKVLHVHQGKKIVMGTHGDIMTLMMNHFDAKYDYDFWESTSMPDIYKLNFAGNELRHVERLWK